ncbi:MAG: hypothetical protein P8N50_05370 [Actinomycetota bacterium]|jgi:hypothetical protein|nr:hypothetical protein [Actinomycetota bacterium]
MTAKRKGTSGRTTPKGTVNAKKKRIHNDANDGDGDPLRTAGLPRSQKVAKNPNWVARPNTHNRGDR